VLEKRNVELWGTDKDGKRKEFIFFEEFKNIKEG